MIENYPVLNATSKEIVGEQIQFYLADSGMVIVHQKNKGFIPVTQDAPWLERIRNTHLPQNVKFFALLTPEFDIKIYRMTNINNRVEYSWSDMAYMSAKIGFDLLSRELCP
jgi:hypothetical protein